MVRTVLVLLIGILGGAAAAHYLAPPRLGGSETAGSVALGAADPAGDLGGAGAPATLPVGPGPTVAERSSIYRVAVNADATELRRLIDEAAAGAVTRTQRFTLEVLLARLAEIDPAEAVRALGLIRDPRVAMPVGLAVLEGIGNTERNLERVLAALPHVDQSAFRVEALGLLAAAAPDAALAQALSSNDRALRGRALEQVAKVWARTDARGALERLDLIGDPQLASAFQANVLMEWVNQDAVAVLEYVSTLRDAGSNAMRWIGPVMQGLARADPQQVLEMAARLPSQTARMAQQIALQQLAQQDPLAALAYAEMLPAGMERQQILRMVANGYGRADPDAALAWARNQRPPVEGLTSAVLAGLAQADPLRALDLALTGPPLERMQALQMVVMNATASGAGDPSAIADKLAALPDSSVKQQALQALIQTWASTDGEAALRWLVGSGERVNADAYRFAASRFPQENPNAAAEYVDRVPNDVRSDWISAVAIGYARTDPQRAMNWLARFRGDPAYEAGVAAAAQGLAQVDPQAAARLLEGIGTDSQTTQGAVMMVAMQWAQQDPPAAAQWAAGIGEPRVRDDTLAVVGQRWAALDPQGARGWVLGLASGAARDRALGAVVAGLAAVETPDSRLLGAFTTNHARELALPAAVAAIAQRDRTEARDFLDQHITDPALRQQAEQMIDGGVRFAPYGMSPLMFGAQPGMPAIRVAPGR